MANKLVCYISVLCQCVTPVRYTSVLHQCGTPVCYTSVLQQCVTPVCYTSVLYQCVTPVCYKKEENSIFTQKSLCGSFSKFQWSYSLDTKSSQVMHTDF